MRKAYQVLAFLLAVEVVVQAAAIAYGTAGVFRWVDHDHGVLNKGVLDAHDGPHFRGVGGFELHGINGTAIIPLLTLAFLVVSFFTKLPGASKRAGIITGLVVLQIVLGLGAGAVVELAPLHAINGFALFSLAVMTGVTTRRGAAVEQAAAPEHASV